MKRLSETDFLSLFQENIGIVYKICYLYGNSQADQDDLFQEISIQLWKAYPSYKGTAKFSTWMYRVALNTSITFFRKGKKRRLESEMTDTVSKSLTFEDFDPTTEERLKLMYQAIGHLNEIEKAIVFLYLEDKAYDEISQTLGISNVNARVKMNRIKHKLRELLTDK